MLYGACWGLCACNVCCLGGLVGGGIRQIVGCWCVGSGGCVVVTCVDVWGRVAWYVGDVSVCVVCKKAVWVSVG